MNNRHVIENAVFDISFGSEEDAFKNQFELDDFVKGRLMPVVDRVFDELAGSEKVFRIEELEIDLGDVAYDGYQDKIVARLEDRLRTVLRIKLQSITAHPSPIDTEVSRYDLEFEQLQYFLLNGRMPWHAGLGLGQALDQLLQRVAGSGATRLRDFLRGSTGRRTAINRLVSQFPDEVLASMVASISGSHAGFVTGFVDELRELWLKDRLAGYVGKEARDQIWEHLIDELVETGAISFDRRYLASRIIQRIEEAQAGSRSELSSIPSNVVTPPETSGDPGPQLQESTLEPRGGPLAEPPAALDDHYDEMHSTVLADKTGVAPMAGDESRSQSLALVRSFDLYDYVRHRLVHGRPPDDGREDSVTTQINQLAREFPWELLRLFRELQAGDIAVGGMVAGLTPQELGHIIQTFLSLTQETSEEGPSDLVRAIGAYAGRANDLRSYYRQVLERLVQDEIIDLEIIVESDQPAMETVSQNEAAASVPPDMDGHGISDLADYLREGRVVSGTEAASHDEAAKETEAAASVQPNTDGDGLSDLADHLREERVVSGTETASHEEAARETEAAASVPPDTDGDGLSDLVDYLREGRVVSGTEAARLARFVESLLAVQSARIRDLLDRSLVQREASNRLIDLLADRTITRVLLLMRPAEHYQVQRLADTLAAALPFKELSLVPGLVRRLKWQFIFRYLFEDGRGFEQDDFIRSFAAFVARETGQVDPGSFLTLLTQKLATNILPATREIHQDILRALTRVNGAYQGGTRELPLAEGGNSEQKGAPSSAQQPGRNFDARSSEGSSESGFEEPGQEDHRAESLALIHSYDLYDHLLQSLVQTTGVQEREVEPAQQIIAQLAREYPWQLLRLFRELQAGGLSTTQVAAALSVQDLTLLVQSFLALNQQVSGEGSTDLMLTIDIYAGRSADQHRFYFRVLDSLVLGHIIDFEGIAADNDPVNPSQDVEAPPVPHENVVAAAWPISPSMEDLEHDSPASPGELSTSSEETRGPSRSGEDGLDALAEFLQGDRTLSAQEASLLAHSVELIIAGQPARMRSLLDRLMAHRDVIDRLIGLLTDRLLTRVLFLVRPVEHHLVQRSADILAEACQVTDVEIGPGRVRQLKWQFIFRYLMEERRHYELGDFVRRFAGFVADETGQTDRREFLARLGQRLALNILPSTREIHLEVLGALTELGPAETEARATAPREEAIRRASRDRAEEPNITENIYIANAGLVLAAPYLPRLFNMLGLTQGAALPDVNGAERAVHLLQYMANQSTDTPEYQLVLNKILCGVPLGRPIVRSIDISDGERETVDGLILGIIQNWTAIGSTSPAGFRESFLQREGRLQLRNDSWQLLVEPRPFDMLLDRIPWSFSIIKHAWMDRVLHVEWR